MKKLSFVFLLALVLISSLSIGQVATVKFKKQLIAMESAEAVGVMDVNGDGVLDIVSGSYWYMGPEFTKRQLIGQVKRVSEYFDDFSTIPMDVNGDGKMDFVTGGWFDGTLIWKENPGENKEWPVHTIAVTGNIETTRAWDVDGDGNLEIVPNTPNKPLSYFKLKKSNGQKPEGFFEKFDVAETQGHGLGFGDINGDGRGDFVVSSGWIEAPEDRRKGTWTHHPDFELGSASVPVLVVDVNQDGLNDLIVGQGHGYGLYWLEQMSSDSKREFKKHEIDPFQSQYHTMEWEDIDNDGEMELITGKRFRAHNGNDPGADDHLGLYYFKWNGETFTKNVISYGPFGEGKGAGLFFSVADLNGSGWKDIIVAGKDGLFVFFNQGN